MNKRKRHRVEIRPDLVADAEKIQQCCALESWGAAINLVFALYRGQVLQRLNTPGGATAVVAAAKPPDLYSEALEIPAPPIVAAEPIKEQPRDLRSFLNQVKDEPLM